jgi:peptidoglycan LD-endopeptidase LytH
MFAAFAVGIAVGSLFVAAWVWYQRRTPDARRLETHSLPDTRQGREYSAGAAVPALPPSPEPIPSRSPVPTTLEWTGRVTPADSGTGDLAYRHLMLPVIGVNRNALVDTFASARGQNRKHEALDIMAARGTPVMAADEGNVVKLFTSKQGGLTVYQFDHSGKWCYYYAHLDRYADGLIEGMLLRKGETLGYVGSTGDADPGSPHLHFAIFQLGPEKHWWDGTAVNPFPLFAQR